MAEIRWPLFCSGLSALLLIFSLSYCSADPAIGLNSNGPVLDPAAAALVSECAIAYADVSSYSERMTVISTGTSVDLNQAATIQMAKPSFLLFKSVSAEGSTTIVCDGKNVYALKPDRSGFYAETPAPPEGVSAVVTQQVPTLSFSPVFFLLAQQLSLKKILDSGNFASIVVGPDSIVDGHPTDAVVFTSVDGSSQTWFLDKTSHFILEARLSANDNGSMATIIEDHMDINSAPNLPRNLFNFVPAIGTVKAQEVLPEPAAVPSDVPTAVPPAPTYAFSTSGKLADVISYVAKKCGVRIIAVLPLSTFDKVVHLNSTSDVFDAVSSLCIMSDTAYRLSAGAIVIQPVFPLFDPGSLRPQDVNMFELVSSLSDQQLAAITWSEDFFAPTLSLDDLTSSQLVYTTNTLRKYAPPIGEYELSDLPPDVIRLVLSYAWDASFVIDNKEFDVVLDDHKPTSEVDCLRYVSDETHPGPNGVDTSAVTGEVIPLNQLFRASGPAGVPVRVSQSLANYDILFSYTEPSYEAAVADFLRATTSSVKHLPGVTFVSCDQLAFMQALFQSYDRWRRLHGVDEIDTFDLRRGKPIVVYLKDLPPDERAALLAAFNKSRAANPPLRIFSDADLLSRAKVDYEMRQTTTFRIVPTTKYPSLDQTLSQPYQHEVYSDLN